MLRMKKKPIQFILFITILCVLTAHAQFRNSTEELKKMHDTVTVDSLRMYYAMVIGQRLLDNDVIVSLRYLNESYDLLKKGFQYSSSGKSRAYTECNILNLMAIAFNRIGDVKKGIEFRMQQVEVARASGEIELERLAFDNLASDQETQGNYAEALKFEKSALRLALKENDPYGIGLTYGNLGSIYGSLKKTDSMLYYFKASVPYLQKISGNKVALNGALGWMMNNLGDVFLDMGELDSAYHYFHLSRQYREEINHNLGKFIIYDDLAKLHLTWKNEDSAFYYVSKSIALGTANGFVQDMDKSYNLRSEVFRKMGKFREALDDYVKSIQLRDSIVNEENGKSLLRQSMQYEHKMEQLADSLEYARKEAILKEQAEKQRIRLMAAAGGLILLVSLAYSIYKGKKRSDELLLNILPRETALELKRKGRSDAKLIDDVTVLFTDFKGFTQVSEKLSPQELVAEIDACFSAFDNIVQKYKVEKIKTIGDSYMCAGGLPVPNTTHAIDVIHAALEIQQFMQQHKAKREAEGKLCFEIRIGIHSGPVVAGIVGVKKYSYDIWGDTVNTASRMESSGEPGKINISGATYNLVKSKFKCTYRGKISAKNKGEIDMYYVETVS
jgi:class 3 adenylate cyclase